MSARGIHGWHIWIVLAILALAAGAVSGVRVMRDTSEHARSTAFFSYPDGPDQPPDLLRMSDAFVVAIPMPGAETILSDEGNGLRLVGTQFKVVRTLKGSIQAGSVILVARTDIAGATSNEEGPFNAAEYALALRSVDSSGGIWVPLAGPSGRVAFAVGSSGQTTAVVEDPGNAIQETLAGKSLPEVLQAITGNP